MTSWTWFRRLSPGGLAYVATAAALAGAGFASSRPALIGIAALVTLPVSIAAAPAFYLVAGVLGLVPGANLSHASGVGYAGPHGTVVVESGEPAVWYLLSLDVLGVLAVALAAVANVLLLDLLRHRRRRLDSGT